LAAGGILLASLALVGAYQLIVTERACINRRIWFQRYDWTLLVATAAAGLSWLASQMMLFKLPDIAKNLEKAWTGFGLRNYPGGLNYYVPGMLLYEFLTSLAALTGMAIVVSLCMRSRLALFSLFWLVLSCAFFLGSSDREPDRIVLLLLPMVIVSALGIDYVHHTRAWPYARAVLIALGALTVYVQVLANFKYAAPGGNEASSARHANLYWRGAATTSEARARLREIRWRFPEQGGTVFIDGPWQPSLRWYLREFRPTSSAEMADLVIYSLPGKPIRDSDVESFSSIDLQESWSPAIGALNAARAIRFVFTAEAWLPLPTSTIAIMTRTPSDSAPTLILPPSS
jgi:hypothetical protein